MRPQYTPGWGRGALNPMGLPLRWEFRWWFQVSFINNQTLYTFGHGAWAWAKDLHVARRIMASDPQCLYEATDVMIGAFWSLSSSLKFVELNTGDWPLPVGPLPSSTAMAGKLVRRGGSKSLPEADYIQICTFTRFPRDWNAVPVWEAPATI